MPRPAPKTALFLVFVTVCIDLLGFGLVLPLLPIYGEELTSTMSPATAGMTLGILMSCYTMMQFLFAPVWGRLSDRFGRRPILLMSLTGSTTFYFLFGLASAWRSLPWMFVARIGAGIAGATIPTAQAYIADVTTPEKRARGMALIGAAFGLGFTLGPLIGAAATFVSRDAGVSPWPGYAASGLSAIALCFALFKLPESLRREKAPEERRHFHLHLLLDAIKVPSIAVLLVVVFFSVFALANFEGTISLLINDTLKIQSRQTTAAETLTDHDRWLVSLRVFLVFAYIGVIQCLVQGVLVRRLANTVSEAKLAVTGVLLSVAGFVLLAVMGETRWGGIPLLMFAAAVEVGGIAFVFPAIQALISRRTDPAEQGGILGAGESVSAMARITGILFGVWLYSVWPSVPFWSAAAMMAIVCGLVLWAVRTGEDYSADSSAVTCSPTP
ncbi:MAG: MFS transporter [Planctomycetaceae bacterium]|nr:MFS transporter [Planctomycetaceae bacterium]